MNVAELLLIFRGEAGPALRAVKEVGAGIGEVQAKAEKAHAGLLGMGAKAAGIAAGAAGVAVLVAAVGKGVEAYRDAEKAQAQLSNAMRDAGQKETPEFTAKVDGLVGKLRQYGVSSADTKNALAKLVEAHVPLETAIKTVTAAEDLHVASGKPLDVALQAILVGAQGTGRAWKEYGINLPPAISTTKALTSAQDAAGKSQAALTLAIQQHGPHSSQATAAAQKLHDAQAKVAKVTQEQSNKFGELDGFVDRVNVRFEGAAANQGPFQNALNKMGGAFDKVAESIGEKVVPYLTNLANWFSGHADQIGNFVTTVLTVMVTVLGILGTAISVVVAVLTPFAEHIRLIGIVLGPVIAMWLAWKAVMFIDAKVHAGIEAVQGGIKAIHGAIDTARLKWMYFKDAMSNVGSAIQSAASVAKAWVTAAAEAVAAFAKMVAQAIADAAVAAATWIAETATMVATAVAGAAVAAASWVAEQATVLAGLAAEAAGAIADFVLMAAAAIASAAAAIAAWLLAAAPFILIGLAIAVLVILVVKYWSQIKDFVLGVATAIGDFVTGVFRRIGDAFAAMFNFIKDHWQLILAILTGPIGIAVAVIAHFWDDIKNGFSAVVRWIGDRLGDLVGFFRELPGRVAGFIASIGQFIMDKLGQAIQWVFDKIKSIPSAVWQAVGGIFGVGNSTFITDNMPPRTAAGGYFTTPQIRSIAESGPEWIRNVEQERANTQRLMALGAQGGGGTNIGPIYVTQNDPTPAEIAQQLAWHMKVGT